MARMLSTTILIGLLVGCVTVTDDNLNVKFDKIQIAESRIELGLAYLEEGQWERARHHLETAVQIAPKYYRSRLSFAHYLQAVGEEQQAELQYKMALRHSPKNGDVYNNYGVFLCREARFDDAQRAFAQAIVQPQYYSLSATYENAALCALKAGDKNDAKVWFKKAIAHEPNRPIATLKLAELETAENEFDEARSRLFALHKRYGYQPDTLLALIEVESKAKQPISVEKYANLLAKRFPKSKQYRQYLANEY